MTIRDRFVLLVYRISYQGYRYYYLQEPTALAMFGAVCNLQGGQNQMFDDDNEPEVAELRKIEKEGVPQVENDDMLSVYMKQMGKIPLLKRETELHLAKTIDQ